MPGYLRTLIGIAIGFVWMACPLAEAAQNPPDQKKTIRLYIPDSDSKSYLLGYDWLRLNLARKIQMVEMARRGALKMNAVMSLPAEHYVREVDRLLLENSQIRQMEIGQVIQGVAISMKDWDDGTAPERVIQRYAE